MRDGSAVNLGPLLEEWEPATAAALIGDAAERASPTQRYWILADAGRAIMTMDE